MNDYSPPVAALLSLGAAPLFDKTGWLDYRARGIGPEHVGELMRLLLDPELIGGDYETAPPYAPSHAARALGQLRAVEAAGTLLRAIELDMKTGGDVMSEDARVIFPMIGPAAVPILTAAFREDGGVYFRWMVADTLAAVAGQHPEARDAVVAEFVVHLEQSAQHDPELNAGVVAGLRDLKAVETASVIERAFEAGHVDESIFGDWPEVRFRLGLGERPHRPDPFWVEGSRPAGAGRPSDPAKERARNRKKQAKQSRKKNRKKKK